MTTDTTQKLPAPCPFCGDRNSKALEIHGRSFVECRTCGAQGPINDQGDRQSAVVDWNRRAADVYTPIPSPEEAARNLQKHAIVEAGWEEATLLLRKKGSKGNLLRAGATGPDGVVVPPGHVLLSFDDDSTAEDLREVADACLHAIAVREEAAAPPQHEGTWEEGE